MSFLVANLPPTKVYVKKQYLYDHEKGHGEFVARSGNTPVNKVLSKWKELNAPRPIQRTGIPASGV